MANNIGFKAQLSQKEEVSQEDLLRGVQTCQSRYWVSDFNDGVKWHNNDAENGIRHICVQRKISGSFGGRLFPHYLRMVSILQTCKLQDKSFFKFLLSKEKNIESLV